MAVEFATCSDTELVRQTRAGSLAAFETLVYRYERRVYSFVAHSCRNAADAAEITQDTFVKAFQAVAQFDERHSFAAWLFTIARRKCIDHHRTAPPTTQDAAVELQDSTDPAALLSTREEQQDLWRMARRVLSEAQFQAIWLRYAEDVSIAEIAQVLGKTQTLVKVLLFRARKAMARELQETKSEGEWEKSQTRGRRRKGGGQEPEAGNPKSKVIPSQRACRAAVTPERRESRMVFHPSHLTL
jgi:RNA polymerase sigma-70 factor (ECF subfamily)